MIDPGQMTTRFVYEDPVRTGGRDALGKPLVRWEPRFELWGRLTTTGGDEAEEAGKAVARARRRVETRFRPGFATTGRLRVKNTERTLEIETLDDVEGRGVELAIGCVERPPKEGG